MESLLLDKLKFFNPKSVIFYYLLPTSSASNDTSSSHNNGMKGEVMGLGPTKCMSHLQINLFLKKIIIYKLQFKNFPYLITTLSKQLASK